MSLPDLLGVVLAADRSELPGLVGQLAAAQAAALARLTTPEAPAQAEEPVRLLDVDEAARLANTSRRWLLRHTRGLRFRRDLSRKAVRFEEAGLLRWIRSKVA